MAFGLGCFWRQKKVDPGQEKARADASRNRDAKEGGIQLSGDHGLSTSTELPFSAVSRGFVDSRRCRHSSALASNNHDDSLGFYKLNGRSIISRCLVNLMSAKNLLVDRVNTSS